MNFGCVIQATFDKNSIDSANALAQRHTFPAMQGAKRRNEFLYRDGKPAVAS
jgi:hypothetical protein